ncbi:MAG: cysteine desulfurase family protein, partial [Burkholderiales bacterium]
MKHVYFDHNATTPLDERVLAAMLPYLRDQYGNASSRHEFGTLARTAVNQAREQVAALVGVQPVQIVFTSGGTEANNAFIKGAAGMLKPSQIAVSAIEHPCVAKPAQELVRAGWKLRKLAVDSEGRVDLADVKRALQEPTGIVSVMRANNETGVIQDVAAVAEQARAARAWVHTDAVQALGKVDVDFNALNVHAMTLSAHKIYGPKGVGALVLDKRIELKPLISGGGHEQGLRSGTENVAGIVGFGAASELAATRMNELAPRLAAMRDRLERGLHEAGAVIFGVGAARVPNTSYFALPGIEGETLVIELDNAGFAVASGAACSSTSTEPSATL